MKEEVLSKIAEKALEYLNSTELFVNREFPIFLEEVLKYGFYSSILHISALFIVAIVGVAFLIKGASLLKKDFELALPFFIISICLLPPFFIFGIDHADKIINIKTAPRVYLIKYFKDMR